MCNRCTQNTIVNCVILRVCCTWIDNEFSFQRIMFIHRPESPTNITNEYNQLANETIMSFSMVFEIFSLDNSIVIIQTHRKHCTATDNNVRPKHWYVMILHKWDIPHCTVRFVFRNHSENVPTNIVEMPVYVIAEKFYSMVVYSFVFFFILPNLRLKIDSKCNLFIIATTREWM